jgi:hypothetical protein
LLITAFGLKEFSIMTISIIDLIAILSIMRCLLSVRFCMVMLGVVIPRVNMIVVSPKHIPVPYTFSGEP